MLKILCYNVYSKSKSACFGLNNPNANISERLGSAVLHMFPHQRMCVLICSALHTEKCNGRTVHHVLCVYRYQFIAVNF